MTFTYHDTVSHGEFTLFAGEKKLSGNDLLARPLRNYYVLAINTGLPARVVLDDEEFEMPSFSILPIMFSQRYAFEDAGDIILWKFNREFYCVVDHDEQVGCAGFLFYGSWGQLMLETAPNEQRKLRLLIDVFKEEFEERDDIQGDMLRMLLVRLIITITRIGREKIVPHAKAEEEKFDLLRQFNLLVELHYKKEHEVRYYASRLFKSPKTLANYFAKYGSKSPRQIIQDRISIEAKRQLTHTNRSVKEVAQHLGFEDPAHFSRFMKQQLGYAPSELKKANKKEG